MKEKSETILRDSAEIGQLIQSARIKIAQSGEKIASVKTEVIDLLDMIKSYVNGSYTEIPWKSLVAITTGLIYFVNPFDLLPDFIVAVGYVDDLKVLEIVLKQVKGDLKKFREYKETDG